jgi:glutaredoxin
LTAAGAGENVSSSKPGDRKVGGLRHLLASYSGAEASTRAEQRAAVSAGKAVRLTVKLHRCSTPWKFGPCWRVQNALDEQGVDYQTVKGPMRPGKRTDLQRISGQRLYPVIEFENGSVYREESTDMAATIRAGRLAEKLGKGSS